MLNTLSKIYGLEIKIWAILVAIDFMFIGEILMEGLAPKRTSETRIFLKLILK